jgi:hypothetical protein
VALGWGEPRLASGVHYNVRVGVIPVAEKHFGAGPVRATPFKPREPQALAPVRALPPRPARFTPPPGKAVRPPPAAMSRSVVATRPPQVQPKGAPPRVVTPPRRVEPSAPLPRPAFGTPGAERPRPAPPQRYDTFRKAPGGAPPAAKPPPARPDARALPGQPANGLRKPAADRKR